MDDKYYLSLAKSKEKAKKEAFFQLNKTTERYAELLTELIETAYDIQENKRLEKRNLDKFEEGMRQGWEFIFFHWSGKFVAWLSNDFTEAEELLLKLWKDKSVQIRQRVIINLYAGASQRVVDSIVREALNDKGKYIRGSISGFISEENYIQYLPLLEERLRIEPDDWVREALEKNISFMTKGYYIKPWNDGKVRLQIKTRRGIYGRIINKDDIEKYTSKEYLQNPHQY